MKAQERHELRENDLASFLQYGLWAFIKQNGSYILLIIALCFLGYQLWNLAQTRAREKVNAAWAEYYNLPYRDNLLSQYISSVRARALLTADATAEMKNRADADVKAMEEMVKNRPSRLREYIDNTEIKPLQAACYMEMGEHYRRLLMYPEIMSMVNLSRTEVLEKQAAAYQGALAAMPDDLLTAGQAQLGIAGNFEDRGDWDKAADAYKVMTDKNSKFAGTALADLASQRAASLEDRRKTTHLSLLIPDMTPKPQPTPGLSLESLKPSSPPATPGLIDFNNLLGNTGSLTSQPSTAPASGLGSPFGIMPLGPVPNAPIAPPASAPATTP